MKKVLVFLADGFEEIEALTPVDYLRRAGAEVVLVATGTASCMVTGAHKIVISADMALDSYIASAKGALPDAVVVPGGMPGASNIASCRTAIQLIREMNEQKRLVAAICAAPAVVLPSTGALKGRKWTCYPGMSSKAGAFESTHEDGVPYITDGNLVTGRGPGAAEQFSMEIVRLLYGEEVSANVSVTSCQRV